MMDKLSYLIEDLTDEVLYDVLNNLDDDDFEMGTVNEVLTTTGREKINQSIYKSLNNELEFYKKEARNKLVEYEVLKGIQRMVSLNLEEFNEFSEALNDLIEEYNEKMKKVQFIENIISDLRRSY